MTTPRSRLKLSARSCSVCAFHNPLDNSTVRNFIVEAFSRRGWFICCMIKLFLPIFSRALKHTFFPPSLVNFSSLSHLPFSFFFLVPFYVTQTLKAASTYRASSIKKGKKKVSSSEGEKLCTGKNDERLLFKMGFIFFSVLTCTF